MALVDFSLSDIGNLFTGVREAITGEKIKDPIEVAKIELQLQQLETALQTGQLEINKVEAASHSVFVAGWRPAIGWVAAVSLGLMYIPKALVMTYIWTYKCYVVLSANINNDIPPFPDLGAMDIIGLVISMLGVAGMRTFEKINGVARKK